MAAPEGILRFLDDYPGAGDYQLTVSHRCGSEIVKWARFVIESNPDRPTHKTRLVTPDDASKGETAFLSFPSQVTEARGVADLVEHLIRDEGLGASDILIMSRSDYHGQFSKPIKKELDDRGISVDDPSWVDEVVNADANRRVLLLARLLSNRTDSLAWAGLLHLTAGIGPTFQTAIYDRAKRDGVTFADALIAGHAEDFPESGGAAVGKVRALMNAVIAWLGANEPPEEAERAWGEWLRDVFTDEAPAHISDELDHVLGIADAEVEPDVSLDRYMGQIIVLAKDHAAARASGVRFMTMSMSKGLTVGASIVTAAERGVIPDPRGREDEERRLLYVAMTRARRFSYVTMAGRRTGPTARSGAGQVQRRRNDSPFLTRGPVRIEPGDDYIKRRWPRTGRRAGAA